MTFDPNAAWTAIRQRQTHQPVYFARLLNATPRIRPASATTYGSDAAWTAPTLAYDGDVLTAAHGFANIVDDVQQYASMVLIFPAVTVARMQPKVLVSIETVDPAHAQYVEAFYSTDNGASWSALGTSISTGTSLLEGPELTNVSLGLFRIRLRTWYEHDAVIPTSGLCYEAYVEDFSNQVDYSTGPVLSPSVAKQPWLTEIEYEGGASDVIDGSLEIGVLRLTIADVDGTATQLLGFRSETPLWNQIASQRVDLFAGYRELPESQYARIFRGRISDVGLTDDLSGITLTCEDVKAGIKQTVMGNARDKSSLGDIQGGTPAWWPYQPIILEGNPINVFGAILLDRFSLTDPDFPLTRIVGGPRGCGLDPAYDINVAAIKAVRDAWFDSYLSRFTFTESFDASEWAAANIFQMFGPVAIDGSGRIAFFPWEPPIRTAISTTLTDADALRIAAWRLRTDVYQNAVRVDFNFDPWERAYDAHNLNEPNYVVVEDEQDIASSKVRRELERACDGFHWDIDGYKQARDRASKILRWLKTPPVELVVAVPFTRSDIEVGDVLSVTLSDVPDVTTGLRGIANRPMRVTAVKPDVGRGTFEVTLMEFGYLRYGSIAPDSVVSNYPGWTQDQKDRYAAIASNGTETVGSPPDPAYRMI